MSGTVEATHSKTLLLHIGMGKAGSTAIQTFLRNVDGQLTGLQLVSAFGGSNAWKLSAISRTERAENYWVKNQKKINHSELQKLQALIWKEAKHEVNKSSATMFVASSEYIFPHYGIDTHAIEMLRKQLFKIFDEVKVIIYLRDQVSWLKSFYSQRIKGPSAGTESFAKFIDDLDSYYYFWDYYSVCDAWAQVFGEERLDVNVYDRSAFRNGSIVSDFVQKIGLKEHVQPNFCMQLDYRKNVSPGYRELTMLRIVNLISGRRCRTRPVIALRRLISKIGIMLPSEFPENYDAEIRKKMHPINEKVNARFLKNKEIKLPV